MRSLVRVVVVFVAFIRPVKVLRPYEVSVLVVEVLSTMTVYVYAGTSFSNRIVFGFAYATVWVDCAKPVLRS